MAIDEKRARLLDAAGHEFAAKGFEGATVRAICERAGMNMAAVNYHFGDKERLYEEVVLHAHRSGPKVDPAILIELEPQAALRRYISAFVSRVFTHPQSSWHQAVMFHEMSSPTRASDALVREAMRPSFEILLAIIHRLAPDLDERRLMASGLSVIGQCLHYKLCGSITERIIGAEAYERLDPEFLADHITRFSLAALGQPQLVAPTESTETNADLIPRTVPSERGA